jgi:hypothetical protein
MDLYDRIRTASVPTVTGNPGLSRLSPDVSTVTNGTLNENTGKSTAYENDASAVDGQAVTGNSGLSQLSPGVPQVTNGTVQKSDVKTTAYESGLFPPDDFSALAEQSADASEPRQAAGLRDEGDDLSRLSLARVGVKGVLDNSFSIIPPITPLPLSARTRASDKRDTPATAIGEPETGGDDGENSSSDKRDSPLSDKWDSLSLVERVEQGGKVQFSEVIQALRAWPDFAEKVAVLTIDFGRDEPSAERTALESLVIEWINDHPPTGRGTGKDATHCAACDEVLGPVGTDAIPLADHAWVHRRCYDAWQSIRRRQGLAAILKEAFGE